MKRSVIVVIVCALLLSLAQISNASTTSGWKELPEAFDIAANKSWAVEVPAGSTVEGAVVEREGRFVPVWVTLFENKVIVTPAQPYERGGRYALRVFLSNGQKLLRRFTVELYPSITAGSEVILSVDADPEQGFHYGYLLYLPASLRRDADLRLLVEPNNSGTVSDDLNFHAEKARQLFNGGYPVKAIADNLGIPALVPVIPRPSSIGDMYTHDLNRKTLSHRGGALERLDLQLIEMVKDARRLLAHNGFKTQEKIFMNGFSASGNYVIRFSLIHPEVVRAVAGGGHSGLPTLPVSEYAGQVLNYPVGINDLEELTGKKFNAAEAKKVARFIYLGDQDTNNTLFARDMYSQQDSNVLSTVLTQPMASRWTKSQAIWREADMTAQFHTYKGIGHWPGSWEDLIAFFKANNNSNTGMTQITPIR